MTSSSPNALTEWEESPALSEALPIRFSDGSQAPSIRISCAGCGRKSGLHQQRGHVVGVYRDVFQVTGLLACGRCKGLTRFNYRIRCTGGMLSLEWNHGGKWQRTDFEVRPWQRVWFRWRSRLTRKRPST
ncbi:hypothetical protein BSFA1_81000 (plasmid) [Burkholderia sp. SFA1]|nr:hypothetical protein BSFA1_81000 [Burkholderia sp. SFA1]